LHVLIFFLFSYFLMSPLQPLLLQVNFLVELPFGGSQSSAFLVFGGAHTPYGGAMFLDFPLVLCSAQLPNLQPGQLHFKVLVEHAQPWISVSGGARTNALAAPRMS
jgi:hypothetical protein